MKKLFQRLDNNPKDVKEVKDVNYIGKVFNVGRYSVTVEEIIAEGKYCNISILQLNLLK